MGGWFRMYDAVIDDHKVMSLPKELRWDWFSVLCIANRHKGQLPAMSELAFNLRISEAEALAMVTKLKNAGLLESQQGNLRPHNWDGRQFYSDSSTLRVQRFRERQRKENQRNDKGNATGNVSATPSRARTDQTRHRVQTRTEDSSLRSESSIACEETHMLVSRRTPRYPRATLASLQNFEKVRGAYPKRAGQDPKKRAFEAFHRAITARKAKPEMLIAAAGKYAAAVRADGKEGTAYVPLLATWLNEDRWSDDYTPEQANGAGRDKSVHRAAERLDKRVQAYYDDPRDDDAPPLSSGRRD
jgi:hypothetical protein